MNQKQFKVLVAFLLLIGGVGLFLLTRENRAWRQSEEALGGKVLPDFPLNQVSELQIKDKEGKVTLAKIDGTWRVKDRYDYPADFSSVAELLQNIWDLKLVRPIQAGPSQFERLQLKDPEQEKDGTGIVLHFKDKEGKQMASLMLGKQHMRKSAGGSPTGLGGGGEFPDGRYVMPNGDAEKIGLVSETFSTVRVDPKAWLDKAFFKVSKLKSVKVEHPAAGDSWWISRQGESDDMVMEGLTDKEEMDSTKTYSLKNLLSSPSFDDILDPKAKPEETGLDHPTVATLKTFDDFTYTVKIGKPNKGDHYPLRLSVSAVIPEKRAAKKDEKKEDKEKLDKEFEAKVKPLKEKLEKEKRLEGWTYLVAKWTVDTLLSKRADLVKEKEEKKEETATGGKPSSGPSVVPATASGAGEAGGTTPNTAATHATASQERPRPGPGTQPGAEAQKGEETPLSREAAARAIEDPLGLPPK